MYVLPAGSKNREQFDSLPADLEVLYLQSLSFPMDFALDRRPGDRGRIDGHLRRLLEPKRSPEERALAVAFREMLDRDQLPSGEGATVISGQSEDTTMFWTLAPYLLSLLTARGVDSIEALTRMIAWAGTT